jgi:RNA polymerase II-associated factor 1
LYSPPSVRPPLAPEDEDLLRDDEAVTPMKKDGIKRKERPTDKGVAWLVKTQYISPLSMESAKQVLGIYFDIGMDCYLDKQQLINILL